MENMREYENMESSFGIITPDTSEFKGMYLCMFRKGTRKIGTQHPKRSFHIEEVTNKFFLDLNLVFDKKLNDENLISMLIIETLPGANMYLRGHAVAQLIEALCYKSEGRGFDSQLCH